MITSRYFAAVFSAALPGLIFSQQVYAKKFAKHDVYANLQSVVKTACSDIDTLYSTVEQPQPNEPEWIAEALALEDGKYAESSLRGEIEVLGLREVCAELTDSMQGYATNFNIGKSETWAIPSMIALAPLWEYDVARMKHTREPTLKSVKRLSKLKRKGVEPLTDQVNEHAVLTARHAAKTRVQRNLEAHIKKAVKQLPEIPRKLRFDGSIDELGYGDVALGRGAEHTVRYYILKDYFGHPCDGRAAHDWKGLYTPYTVLPKKGTMGKRSDRHKDWSELVQTLTAALQHASQTESRDDVMGPEVAPTRMMNTLWPGSVLQWQRKVESGYCDGAVISGEYTKQYNYWIEMLTAEQTRLAKQKEAEEQAEAKKKFVAFTKEGMKCKAPRVLDPKGQLRVVLKEESSRDPDNTQTELEKVGRSLMAMAEEMDRQTLPARDSNYLSDLNAIEDACTLIDDTWKQTAAELATTESLKVWLADFLEKYAAILTLVEKALPEATRNDTACRSAAVGAVPTKKSVLSFKECMSNADLSSTARKYHATDADLYNNFMQDRAVACTKKSRIVQHAIRFKTACPYGEDTDPKVWLPVDVRRDIESSIQDLNECYEWSDEWEGRACFSEVASKL